MFVFSEWLIPWKVSKYVSNNLDECWVIINFYVMFLLSVHSTSTIQILVPVVYVFCIVIYLYLNMIYVLRYINHYLYLNMIWRSDFHYLAYFSQYGAFIPLIWSPNSELFIVSYQYFRLHMPRHFFKRKEMF